MINQLVVNICEAGQGRKGSWWTWGSQTCREWLQLWFVINKKDSSRNTYLRSLALTPECLLHFDLYLTITSIGGWWCCIKRKSHRVLWGIHDVRRHWLQLCMQFNSECCWQVSSEHWWGQVEGEKEDDGCVEGCWGGWTWGSDSNCHSQSMKMLEIHTQAPRL